MKKSDLGTFTENVRKRRREAGFASAEAFAAKIGIPYGTYRDIEAGISEGRFEVREAIAKELKCSIGDLYGASIPQEPLPQWANHVNGRLEAIEKRLEAPATVPIDPDLQKIRKHWGSIGAPLKSSVIYLVTGEDEDLERVHKEIRKEVQLLRRHIPALRASKASRE